MRFSSSFVSRSPRMVGASLEEKPSEVPAWKLQLEKAKEYRASMQLRSVASELLDEDLEIMPESVVIDTGMFSIKVMDIN